MSRPKPNLQLPGRPGGLNPPCWPPPSNCTNDLAMITGRASAARAVGYSCIDVEKIWRHAAFSRTICFSADRAPANGRMG